MGLNKETMNFTEITRDQKLLAIKLKYYDGLEWFPKKGDYYTSCRNDLELYQIVDEDESYFSTNYCNPEQTTPNPAQWPKVDFKKGFGEKRIYVPDFILVPSPVHKEEKNEVREIFCSHSIKHQRQDGHYVCWYCGFVDEFIPEVSDKKEEIKTAEEGNLKWDDKTELLIDFVGWLTKQRKPILEQNTRKVVNLYLKSINNL